MIDKTKAPAAANGSGHSKLHSNSTAAQRSRLLERLREGPLTTIEARRDLDILMPAARVFELRALGHEIATYRINAHTDCGKLHSVARYAYLGAANDAGTPESPRLAEAPPEAS